MLTYSVVIPVYRGEFTIAPLAEKLVSFFEASHLSFEIIFVYDQGPDNSWHVLQQLTTTYSAYIKAIKLSRNFGQHNATICGFERAEGEFIITMDEDLQHQPNDIALLIEEQKKDDYDVVYGKYNELKHSSFRNLTSVALKKMLEVSIPDLHPDYTAFRLIKRNVALATIRMNNSYTFLDGYISWVTTHTSSVTVQHEERIAGKSSYTLQKLINHAINIFVTFSVLPIRLVTFSSFIVFTVSVLYSIYLLVRQLVYNDLISGYASMMISIGLGTGLILWSLGIVGEYLHRVNLKTTQKPNFVVIDELSIKKTIND
ncbi:glycosyltransferase family 2 protein [Rufibacter roseus]|uniref:Glycosyltransferase family 2 protein n=1 Tax=Rufibacter roseus TaxID=1567108 RepID=A0ABW2DLM8_9BACT|nr:glycosyltransferase family 2 protein [Rufibacter roseus]